MDRYVGKRLDGRYEIREIIGVGGMAVVYKAFDTIENRVVAIKILKEEFVSNAEFVRRFKNESKAIAVLSHPNIVKIYDVSFGDLIQYIVMEYIEGITLKQYIEAHNDIPWKTTVGIVMQILRALQHAHDKGIIHRDVKPQNIMLTDDGTIKVTDFGIARFSRSEHRTITDKAIGSVHYISPEQARGDITDEKADIYSVGVIMYEMLTGTLPFEAESAVIVAMMQLQNEAKPMREINPTIPLGLSQITMNAMQKEIARRYQTAAEMLCDLESFRRDPSATFEHSYFVDDAPTRFVEGADTALAFESEEPPKKEKTSWVPMVTGIAVGVAIIVVISIIAIFANTLNSSKKAMKCPDFVGMTVSEIKDKYNENDYTFDITYEETSDYAVGEVIKQDPAEGTEIKTKNKIRLTIATSAELVIVPDVSNDTEQLARKTLKEAGFSNISIEQVYDDVVNEGKAVKTEPLADSKIAPDKPITIYISKGKEIHYTTVPGILGYERESAEKMLESKKLTVGNVTTAQSSQPKGYVISQSIGENTQVEEGTAVNFTISSGENTAYSMEITVNLPTDCTLGNGYVLAVADSGGNYQSQLLSFATDGSCTFTVKSTEERDTLTVKLLDSNEKFEYKYQKISINFSKNTYEVTKTYDDYPKADDE